MIPIYKPYLPKESLKYAHDALDSTWISSQGEYLTLAKEKLKEILGVKYVLLTNTGTAAMHLVAKCLRQKLNGRTRNLIVPNNVYVASWNAFLYDKGQFNLMHTDTDEDTWNMSLSDLNNLQYKAEAVLIVHNLGNTINVPKLKEKYPLLTFVEDNCEGFGGWYDGLPSGGDSFCSAISFYGNKNVTSGEGGAFVTNNEYAYELAKTIHGQGQSQTKYVHEVLGYNYRMTNVQAAILYGQLCISDRISDMKQEVFEDYRLFLQNDERISFQKSEPGTKHSNWMFGVRIKDNPSYEKAYTWFSGNVIETRPFFYPIMTHQHLRGFWGNNTVASQLSKEVILLPSYPELTRGEIIYICDRLREYLDFYRDAV